MIESIATIKGVLAITSIAIMGTCLGTAIDGLDEKTPISMGAAIGVGAVVVCGAWYLSARLQRIDSRLKSIEESLEHNPRKHGN